MKSIIIPLILFTLSMTITPGPNNMLLTVTGARFGFLKTLPMIGGILMGILSQLLLSALGLGVLFYRFPVLKTILKIGGTLYLLYLALKIAFPKKKKDTGKSHEKPMSFIEGAAFQYLNPKAYIMTITAMAVYPIEGDLYVQSALLVAASFAVICPLSISLWAGFGSILNGWMQEEKYSKAMNYLLGAMTAVSAVFILH